ncbi:MAG: hypothetical protein AAF614_11355 [Chloroflexota bacterium]
MSIYKYRFVIPVLAIMSFVFVQQPVVAQSTYWASWEIEIDFVNNQPNAVIFVEAGTYVGGQPYMLHSTQQSFPCHVVGSVEMADEQGHFDGNGYLECESPNVVEIVDQMTGGQMGDLAAECECKTPWAQVDLTLNQNPAQTNPQNPIFSRSDLAIAVPLTGGSDAQVVFTVDGETAVSDIFDPAKKDSVYADFNQQVATKSYIPSFAVNGASYAPSPAVIQNPSLQTSNEAETFYVGFDPDTGDLLEASIIRLRIDPGCFGFG